MTGEEKDIWQLAAIRYPYPLEEPLDMIPTMKERAAFYEGFKSGMKQNETLVEEKNSEIERLKTQYQICQLELENYISNILIQETKKPKWIDKEFTKMKSNQEKIKELKKKINPPAQVSW